MTKLSADEGKLQKSILQKFLVRPGEGMMWIILMCQLVGRIFNQAFGKLVYHFYATRHNLPDFNNFCSA
jgi:hypothetical protein